MISEITQGDYRINITNDTIYIQHVSYNKIVAIDKFNSNLYETDISEIKNVRINQVLKPHSILGILKISNIDFLVYVKICQSVGTIEGAEIFKIREAELIPIVEDSFIQNLSTDVKSTIAGIKQIYSLGFFYSFHYDLTNTRQRIKKLQFINNIIESSEKNFFWNYNMYKQFFEKKIDSIFMVVCICGFVGITNQTIFGNNILFALISRRSVKFAGTRYNTRGIDDEGNVANYVETEQIFKYQNKFLSFVQIRGSAPIFFQQTGMTAQTQITRTPEMTINAYTKHIESIQQNYSLIYLINLMSNSKPNESIITENIENQIKLTKLNTVKYHFFDFHSECKYDNYERIEYIVEQYINQVLNIFKYFCEDMNSGEIYKEQTGVIRTNCLDCLDRTNIIQTRIAWKMFENQVSFLFYLKTHY
jgi:hypothetical protein